MRYALLIAAAILPIKATVVQCGPASTLAAACQNQPLCCALIGGTRG